MFSTRDTSHLTPRSPLSPLSPIDLRRLQLTTSPLTRPLTRRGPHPTPEAPRSLLVKRLFGATTRWSDDDVFLVGPTPTPISEPSPDLQVDRGDVAQYAPPHVSPFISGFDPILDLKQEQGMYNPSTRPGGTPTPTRTSGNPGSYRPLHQVGSAVAKLGTP
ncbi:hypothetical protein EHS25_000372 [Saitozyma podzolica]|uniref:Uncharacterized protein n=1 Tax=Saitozyma podzolica TaxID=1890683 RepID=A0A427YW95_9TREE|nr:hypothetical protein EHS25_000372 [Saitozyma podzolica]